MGSNENLCKSEVHAGKKCARCGSKYPEVLLNIEAVIHHGKPCECLDRKACGRRMRRRRREIKAIFGRGE